MIKVNSASEFRREFNNSSRSESFSYAALDALFYYLQDLYSNESVEVDVVALDCTFCEYDSALAAVESLGLEDEISTPEDLHEYWEGCDISEEEIEENREEEALALLREKTSVVSVNPFVINYEF